MKRFSTSYNIKELQIKTIRCYYIIFRTSYPFPLPSKNHKWIKATAGENKEQTDSHLCCSECKRYSSFERVWQFLINTCSLTIPYNMVILGVIPPNLKTYIHDKNCTQVSSSVIHNCQKLYETKLSFKR